MSASPVASAPPPVTPVRILVIDDDEVILEFLAACFECEIPGAAVTRYNSAERGRPGSDFEWAKHDVLLLDYHLGQGETGVDWLEAFADRAGFPPTLLLTAEDDPKVVGNAVRTGASGYLNKSNLTPEALVSAVQGLVETRAAENAASASSSGVQEPARPVYRGSSSLDTGPGGSSYRFTRLIGRGAMSRVYLAERTEDDSTVVLKILDRDVARDPENVKRFDREGELLSQIDSPYVVKVFDHGSTNSYGYIAMEFFGWGDLAQHMARGVAPEDAVLYLHNIACGLQAIHALDIVHRDLKPGNIMFRGDGSMALTDFGLSKRLDVDMSLTRTGVILGTPYYMSPEQAAGEEPDKRTDLYAAGVIFYEMLTGTRPFSGGSVPELLLAIQRAPVPRLEPSLARYQEVVERLLAKDRADRYQDAGALITALAPMLTFS